MPARLFRAGGDLPDEQLARIYGVPIGKVAGRRGELVAEPAGLGEASYWSSRSSGSMGNGSQSIRSASSAGPRSITPERWTGS